MWNELVLVKVQVVLQATTRLRKLGTRQGDLGLLPLFKFDASECKFVAVGGRLSVLEHLVGLKRLVLAFMGQLVSLT